MSMTAKKRMKIYNTVLNYALEHGGWLNEIEIRRAVLNHMSFQPDEVRAVISDLVASGRFKDRPDHYNHAYKAVQ